MCNTVFWAGALGMSFLWAGALAAQPCLVHGDTDRVSALSTFAGIVHPRLAAVEPGTHITVVLFPQAVAESQRGRTSEELASLYKAASAPSPLTLSVFDGQAFTVSGPFTRLATWQKAVAQALSQESPAAQPLAPAQFYPMLAEAAGNLGGGWNSVLLIGRLPDPAEDVRDYAAAWLARRLCGQHVRVNYWNAEGAPSAFWNMVTGATAGVSAAEHLADLAPRNDPLAFNEVEWPAPPINRGFVFERGELRTQAGAPVAQIPILLLPPGKTAPDLKAYADLRRSAKEAADLVRREKLDEGQAQQVRMLLMQALRVNPIDGEALRAGADFYRHFEDFKTAASLLTLLAQVQPQNAEIEAELGHCQFKAGDLDAAETSLMLAREHKAGGTAALEELARIRLARKDDRGALRFLDETLALEARNSDLWFTRADLTLRIGDASKAEESLEKGIAIDATNLARRTSLVELYVKRGAAEPALRHVRVVTAALPADAPVRRQYAEFLDRLARPDEALEVWKKTLDRDPAMEAAHYRIARILMDKKDAAGALAASDRGLAAAPKSTRLYLLKSEAQERQGRYFAARETLRAASATVADATLLARLAEMEDASGRGAAQVYSRLLALTEKDGPDADTRILERGLETALRDDDEKSAADFRTRLAAAGKQGLPDRFIAAKDGGQGAVVPGGLEGLEFIARFHSRSPQYFFADYCRKLVDSTSVGTKEESNLYLESIRRYFLLLNNLKALGASKDGRTVFALSATDKKARQQTEKVLDLLGWKLRTHKDEITLEAGEKGSQAKRQESASALAIDEVGMQGALQSGKPFRFEIIDGRAAVLLDPARWMDTFFPKENFNGGLAEALTRDLRVAKIYAALSTMSAHAVPMLATGADLKMLAEKHADLLYRYSSSFALNGVHAAVPGGAAAEPVWEKLLGAPPSNPPRFFRALLEKDDGKLLAFFSVLGQLDTSHQKFFTRTVARGSRFYELFRDSRDVAQGAEKQAQSSGFIEFLREIPLDPEGRVLFPGSPGVWMLAKGNSSSITKTAKMVKKLSRVTVPDEEDEILLRLARTRYSTVYDKNSESDNFIAVARIDAHRDDPLDDSSALLLAQHYVAYHSLYPYFSTLTGLGAPQFQTFFGFLEQLHGLPRVELNTVLGDVHSLMALLSLAQESGAMGPEAAAEVFGVFADRFAKASNEAAYTSASLDTIRELLRRVKTDAGAARPGPHSGTSPARRFAAGGFRVGRHTLRTRPREGPQCRLSEGVGGAAGSLAEFDAGVLRCDPRSLGGQRGRRGPGKNSRFAAGEFPGCGGAEEFQPEERCRAQNPGGVRACQSCGGDRALEAADCQKESQSGRGIQALPGTVGADRPAGEAGAQRAGLRLLSAAGGPAGFAGPAAAAEASFHGFERWRPPAFPGLGTTVHKRGRG